MGYFEKQRKRQATEKLTREVMNTTEFKQAMKLQEEQAVLNALGRFTFMMCGFLETRHGYKKAGLEKFLAFVKTSLECTADSADFFKDYDEYYKDEMGLDVLDSLGLGLEAK